MLKHYKIIIKSYYICRRTYKLNVKLKNIAKAKLIIMKTQKTPLSFLYTLLSVLLLSSSTIAAEELIETRTLNSFDKIVATNGINVQLRHSEHEKVDVKIENALLSDIITEVDEDGTLKIKLRAQINKELSILCLVYYKDLKEITATKGASIITKDVLITKKLDICTNTGAKIKAEIECIDVKVDAFGVSNTSLYGWADRLEIKATAGADVFGKTLESKNVFVKAGSGAEVWVKPELYLEAIANMGSTIYYTQKPEKINEKLTTGGELHSKVTEDKKL